MPKIPTFQTQARPTAEAASVTTNIQVSPTTSIAGALTKPISSIAEYYAKEEQITNKVKAGELFADATADVFNAAQEAELKNNPSEGLDYFNQQYKVIKDKYKSQAKNSDVGKYFDLEFSANKNKYVNSILNKTRTNLVSTRVSQTEQKVKSKIANSLAGNNFQFKVLSEDILNDYRGLVQDGIVREEDFNIYKDNLPKLIETEMVRKMSVTNAYQAILALEDPKNYQSIQGEEREELRKDLRTIAKFQNEAVSFAVGKQLLESKKKVAKAFRGEDQGHYGIDPNKLQNYYTGDLKVDNQINELNQKFIDKKIVLDTDYIVNDTIIKKILNKEIRDPFDPFLLPGEEEAKSITQRVGNGTINLDDDNFFNNIFEIKDDVKSNKTHKDFFNFIDQIVPAIEGTATAKIFDNNYNNRLSSFRQDMYKKFNEGLKNNLLPSDLLNPKSNNYIAKDILNYAPTKSDLRNALLNYAKEKEQEVAPDIPMRKKGETYEQWRQRYLLWKTSNKK